MCFRCVLGVLTCVCSHMQMCGSFLNGLVCFYTVVCVKGDAHYCVPHSPHSPHSDLAPTTSAANVTLQAIHAAAVAYSSVVTGMHTQQHEWEHVQQNGGGKHGGSTTTTTHSMVCVQW